jgi:hypothetical protein
MVKYVDKKCEPLIGPTALQLWAPQFPYFAETLREFIMRDKERMDRDGNLINTLNMDGLYIPPNTFNIFGLTDCTFYELCQPGSGPANPRPGAPRKRELVCETESLLLWVSKGNGSLYETPDHLPSKWYDWCCLWAYQWKTR